MKKEDEVLIERLKKGDISAFEELVAKYEKRIYSIAYRMCGNHEDASDLAQEAFIKIFQSIWQFRGKSSFSTWLYRIVVNLFQDWLRKRKRVPIALEDLKGASERLSLDLGLYADPEKIMESKLRQEAVQKAINSLPEHQRAIIVLYDIEGFSYEEISQILKISIGTVKSRLNRARLALKEKLQSIMELFTN